MSDHFEFNRGNVVAETARSTVAGLGNDMWATIVDREGLLDVDVVIAAATAPTAEEGGVIRPTIEDFILSIPQLPGVVGLEPDVFP